MQQEIQFAPFLLDPFEDLLGLTFHGHIERHEDRRFKRLGKRLDKPLCPIVQICHREVRAQRPKRLGASPSDRLIVGNAHDQSLLALQGDLRLGEHWNIHDAISRLAFEFVAQRTDSVCSAIIRSSSVGMT